MNSQAHQHTGAQEKTLLREALAAREQAEAAQLRAECALRAAEAARRDADADRARHELLGVAGRAMAASLDYRATLAEVADAAVPLLGDWCIVVVASLEGELETIALAHSDPAKRERAWDLMRRHPPRVGAPVGAARVTRTGETELLERIDSGTLLASAFGEPARYEALDELAPRAALTVPLKTPTRVLGAISFVFDGPERAFAPEDVQVATSLAARAGLHVQNARLFAERSSMAQTLQRSLLPPALPQIPGVELAARYRAAGGAQSLVGGDFYDVHRAGGDWIAFVGDVCGKGAEAAALTSLTRHTLFAGALRGGDALEQVQLANDALLARSPDMRFATLAHVRLTPAGEDGGLDVELTNAGHPCPLVVRADGRVEETTANGTALGIVDDPVFEQQRLRLAPGDLLLLCTDGVTELRGRPDPDFGLHALRDVLAGRRGCAIDAVVDAVQARAVELQDDRPRDDMAILAIRAGLGIRER